MKHRAVARVAAAEVPALHAALKAFALADAGNINPFADREAVHQHAVAGLRFVLRILDANLAEVAHRSHVGLLEVAGAGLVHTLRLDEFHQAELNGVVSVLIFRAALDDHARAGLQHRARHRRAVFGEDLGHAELDTENSVDCHFVRSFLRKSRRRWPARWSQFL